MTELTISEALALLAAWYPNKRVSLDFFASIIRKEVTSRVTVTIEDTTYIEKFNSESLNEVMKAVRESQNK